MLVVAVLALFLIVSRFGTFPTVGRSKYVAPWDNPVEHFKNFFIPSLVLGIGLGAVWSRLLRADMILTLQSDSILMARSKGISPNRVLWVHALRMSILSLMTSVALQMSALIGGAVVVEQFFGPKGLGDRLVFAFQQNDLLVIQAIAAVLVVVVVFANFVVDLLYAVVDPRIRLARSLGMSIEAPTATAATAASTLAPVAVAEPVATSGAASRSSACCSGCSGCSPSSSWPCSPTTCRSSTGPTSASKGPATTPSVPAPTSGSAPTGSVATCSPAASTAPASR